MIITAAQDGQRFDLAAEPVVQIATALNVDTTISTVLASQTTALNWLRRLARGEVHLGEAAWQYRQRNVAIAESDAVSQHRRFASVERLKGGRGK